ncbi:ThiS family protein [uncultured archaeon]|nr:ThiS family protein [uncultured archaeon]
MEKREIVLDGKKTMADARATSIRQLLAALHISPQEALVKVNGKIRPESAPLAKKDRVEVIRVVFGG